VWKRQQNKKNKFMLFHALGNAEMQLLANFNQPKNKTIIAMKGGVEQFASLPPMRSPLTHNKRIK